MRFTGKPVVEGVAEGELLVSSEPIAFYGGVDPGTGTVTESGHKLRGQSIAGKILALPHTRGSTVGSYTLLRLAGRGLAPAGIVSERGDEILIVGCIISRIPLAVGIPVSELLKVGEGRRALLRVTSSAAELFVE
ncbi:MAG: DUF126 domain-containing protein [Thermofilum sp.]